MPAALDGSRLPFMTTRLAPVESTGGDERQRGNLDAAAAEQDEEAIRVIAALWEWAAAREPGDPKAA